MVAQSNIEDFSFVLTKLCELLATENAALATHNVNAVKELQEQKSSITRLYAQHVQAISQAPTLWADSPPELLEMIRNDTARLQALSATNAKFLKAEMEVTKRLTDNIVAALKEQQASNASYTRKGALDVGIKSPNKPPSLSYDGNS
jgi:flagellar biosynthesis/type III secretory pathway chaperone